VGEEDAPKVGEDRLDELEAKGLGQVRQCEELWRRCMRRAGTIRTADQDAEVFEDVVCVGG
jgi:hypothetical protein